MKKSIKILSVFLAVLTFFSILSAATPVFAANVNEYIADKEYTEKLLTEVVENDTEEKAPIVKEVEEKRDEYQKVYLREDGTYTAVISKTPVHYENDGEWVDIVNDLKTDGDVITNTAGNFNVEFPKEISADNEIKVENGKESLTFSIVETEKSNGKVKNNKKQKQDKNKVSDEEIFNNDISRTVSEIEYEDILENTNLEYVVTPTGVKENIIVENKESLKKSYSFNITKGDLKAELDKSNNLYFKNSKGEIVFTIPAPVMTDSNGAISYDIDVKVKNLKKETITLTYTPDKKWLNDKDRTYPVAIDPVIMLDSDKEFIIEDTVVGVDTTDSETATRNGRDTFLAILVNTDIFRNDLLVKFNPNIVNAYKQPNIVVTDVKYLVNGGILNGNVIAKPITGSWDASTITGADVFPSMSGSSNSPVLTYDDEIVDYYTGCPAEIENSEPVYFDITNLFNEWLSGERPNDGFALFAENEETQAIFTVSGYYSSNGKKNYYYSYCTIDYVDGNGYNSNFEYLTQEVGRAGTVNVNTFTRGLSAYREDLSLPGNRMPVSVGFNYNSALVNYLEWYKDFAMAMDEEYYAFYSPYGDNWSPNYLKMLFTFDDNEYYYFTDTGSMAVFTPKEETITETDENGLETTRTELVFEENLNGETGYELSLISQNSDASFDNMVITTPSGEKEYFGEDGFICKIQESEAGLDGVSDEINITYEDYTNYEIADLALPKIDCITDGVGRKFNFVYTNDKLTKIECLTANNSPIYSNNKLLDVEYQIQKVQGANEYAPEQLTSVKFQDDRSVSYTYQDINSGVYEWEYVLTNIKNIDPYNIDYTYDSLGKVTEIAEYYDSTRDENNTTRGNYITLTQNSNNCVIVADAYNGANTYLFSKTGELLYTLDDKGNYCKNTSIDFSADEDSTEPIIIEDGSWKIISKNLLKNPSFETQYPTSSTRAYNWNNNFTRTSAVSHSGSYAYLVNSTSNITKYNQQKINVSGNKNYTFSAYVKVATAGELTLKIDELNSSNSVINTESYKITNTNDWERFSLTVGTRRETTALYVSFGFENSQGCYYVDSVQLESGLGTAAYNFIENNSFNNNLEYWNASNNTLTVVDETINGESVKALKLPKCMPYFDVISENEAYLYDKISSATQTVTINGKKDEVYSIGAWFKGDFTDGLLSETIRNNSETDYTPDVTRIAQIKATYTYTDANGASVTEDFAVDFLKGINGWQYVNGCFALKGDVTSISVTVITQNIPVDSLITNVELFKDETAVVFSNEDTEETEEVEIEEPVLYASAETEGCPCEDCEDLDCYCTCETEEECTCVSCERRSNIEITSEDGKSVTTQMYDGSKYLQSITTYSDDLNYVVSEKDDNNISTGYTYDETGAITSITDSSNVTTSYQNDAMGYLKLAQTSVSNLSDNKTNISLVFTYNNDSLSTVTADDVVYSYNYDNWGQTKSVSVDNQKLVEYNYGVNEYRSRITFIESQINLDSNYTLNYIYDLHGNIVQVVKATEIDGNVDEISYYYHYDNLGTLLYIDDSNTGRTVRYSADGGVTIEETGTNDVIYKSYYNEDGELIEEIDGVTYTAKSYTADDIDTEETDIEIGYNAETGNTTELEAVVSSNNKTFGVETVTDWFGRTKTTTVMTKDPTDTETEYPAKVRSNRVFVTYDSNKTTNLVKNYANQISGVSGSRTANFVYAYDVNGKITSRRTVSTLSSDLAETNTYAYDEAGQLVRENKSTQNTWIYEYDANGNITKRKTYNYTVAGAQPTALVSTDTFTYATGAWEDRLVSYNGQPIVYDNIGNPTTYLGANLMWHGRELLGYTKGTDSYYYSYDVDGMRYQKVVNKNGVETARYNYVYADGQLILLTYTTGGTTQNAKFIYSSTGEVLGFIVNGTTQYLYVKNLQGDIVAIVNESGASVVRYIYDAWGNVTITTDSGYENLVNLSPFAYRGYCYDNDIKMYYLQSRYYDPQICRFINADSSEYLGATGTVLSYNLFAYCENDPVNCLDASGNYAYCILPAGTSVSTMKSKANTLFTSSANFEIFKNKKIKQTGFANRRFYTYYIYTYMYSGSTYNKSEKKLLLTYKHYSLINTRVLGTIYCRTKLEWEAFIAARHSNIYSRYKNLIMSKSGMNEYDFSLTMDGLYELVSGIVSAKVKFVFDCLDLLLDLSYDYRDKLDKTIENCIWRADDNDIIMIAWTAYYQQKCLRSGVYGWHTMTKKKMWVY
ncbi:MAG: hypothetical protein E7556_08645 [Ruminococcaceae bacterium]|nr:hypothetical protein [Oscillospiraceae bacterium]